MWFVISMLLVAWFNVRCFHFYIRHINVGRSVSTKSIAKYHEGCNYKQCRDDNSKDNTCSCVIAVVMNSFSHLILHL